MFEPGQILGNVQSLIGAACLCAVDGVIRIDSARTLLEHGERQCAVRIQCRIGRCHQPALDIVRRQRRVMFQHQSCNPAHDSRGLARP